MPCANREVCSPPARTTTFDLLEEVEARTALALTDLRAKDIFEVT